MWTKFLLGLVAVMILGTASTAVRGQGTVRSGPDPATIRDPELEKDSLHNFEVAQNYFKLKKAYVAALKRLEEIIAGNPNFTRIEEVLLMAGQSSLWLADGKGKQKSDKYVTFDGGVKHTLTPEQFREMGRGYLTKLINDYPNSPFAKEAQEELRLLGTTVSAKP
ncbi:MAG TPA: outer membrane protein assembly factor BamD [Pyrinomonadaceae bacterium]|nr:outer membrane protein assembly factor BamD [Pyrinomonadaceae bacterium]